MATSDTQHPDAAVVARASALIADFEARQEAWRRQAEELARLHDDVQEAAKREAATIVAAARADIRRIVVGARRELLQLSAQLDAVNRNQAETDPESFAIEREFSDAMPAELGDAAATPESLLRTRRELRALLAEARPELEELATRARPLTDSVVAEEPVNEPPSRERSPFPAPRSSAEQSGFLFRSLDSESEHYSQIPSEGTPVTEDGDDRTSTTRRSRKALLLAISFVALGVVLVAGGVRWLSSSSSADPSLRSENVAAAAARPTTAEPSGAPANSGAPLSQGEPAEPAASTPAQSKASLELWLLVEARRRVMVRTSIDQQDAQTQLLNAGEARRFIAARTISLAVGDAGAVTVAMNGGKPAALGRDGQAVTRIFTADDAVSSIPSLRSGGSPVASTFPPVTANAGSTASEAARSEIERLSLRWFDGYHHRDNNTMAYVGVPDMTVLDERSATVRPPVDLATVRRTFDQVQFDVRGDAAVFNARMFEHCEIAGTIVRHVSLVSENWHRQGDRWRLTGVRIVHDER